MRTMRERFSPHSFVPTTRWCITCMNVRRHDGKWQRDADNKLFENIVINGPNENLFANEASMHSLPTSISSSSSPSVGWMRVCVRARGRTLARVRHVYVLLFFKYPLSSSARKWEHNKVTNWNKYSFRAKFFSVFDVCLFRFCDLFVSSSSSANAKRMREIERERGGDGRYRNTSTMKCEKNHRTSELEAEQILRIKTHHYF